MKIRMRRQHGAYRAGEVVEVSDRDAERLIAWEYATRADGDTQSIIETASIDHIAERSDVTPRKTRRTT